MVKKCKSWQEKLIDNHGLPKVVEVTSKMVGRWGTKLGDTLVIPAPIEVNEIMKKVPKGKLITINKIWEVLAKQHNATISCPITTGIFAWIAANAAEEAQTEGKKNTTPYWRTLKADGEINLKYPGGIDNQKKLLEKESHKIIQKRKKYIILDYEKKLVKL